MVGWPAKEPLRCTMFPFVGEARQTVLFCAIAPRMNSSFRSSDHFFDARTECPGQDCAIAVTVCRPSTTMLPAGPSCAAASPFRATVARAPVPKRDAPRQLVESRSQGLALSIGEFDAVDLGAGSTSVDDLEHAIQQSAHPFPTNLVMLVGSTDRHPREPTGRSWLCPRKTSRPTAATAVPPEKDASPGSRPARRLPHGFKEVAGHLRLVARAVFWTSVSLWPVRSTPCRVAGLHPSAAAASESAT
ncbi:hypothetical protein QE370_000890 [Aeromicrobium sp. SORGH_AS981]|nr:hypothetical protein [Aeromicrobium sp. SORGH_AS_0981]